MVTLRRPVVVVTALLGLAACAARDQVGLHDSTAKAVSHRPTWRFRGAWLAPRSGHPLDTEEGSEILRQMRALGVRQVAIGHDVQMPRLIEPRLVWGVGDEALRGFLRRANQLGLETFLLPRIESPDFFRPPYPFRGDIRFATAPDWERFHDQMEEMLLHYARLAEEEGVAVLGLGLELKHSARGYPERWRQIIRRVRAIYHGKVTYSANWWREWEHVAFWDALDFIGIGAYFELAPQSPEPPGAAPGSASRQELFARWRGVRERLRRAARSFRRPVLFTEVGYTGYSDCAERPWEWAGKQEKGAPIDHEAQARALGALLDVVAAEDCIAGLFVWSFYTNPENIADWEYGLQGRPAEAVLRAGYGGR